MLQRGLRLGANWITENLLFVSICIAKAVRTIILLYVSSKGYDGHIFSNLRSGRYTVFIEARGTEDPKETASDIIGPIILVAGINANAPFSVYYYYDK